MKIVFFEVLPAEKEFYSHALGTLSIEYVTTPLTEASGAAYWDADYIVIFIHSRITAKLLECFIHLKGIITRSTGYDHIDVYAVQQRAIKLYTLAHYATVAVAEYTLALLMTLARKLIPSTTVHTTCYGNYAALQGFEINQKILGVIGTGAIGKAVIARAQGLGMHIRAHDSNPDYTYARQVGIEYYSYEQVLQEADILTFHVALNDSTKGLFNASSLSLIKKGVYIINTARGAVVEARALIAGLDTEAIAGAALDVLEYQDETNALVQGTHYPVIDSNAMQIIQSNIYLMHHPRVQVSCHTAFNTLEAAYRQQADTGKLIAALARGECLPDFFSY